MLLTHKDPYFRQQPTKTVGFVTLKMKAFHVWIGNIKFEGTKGTGVQLVCSLLPRF